MGIQGLLPLLNSSTRDAHINEFENEFVAIDAYCWLHKGIYSCAVEIAMKTPTAKYVTYCMRYLDMLLYFKVKPILVFDGKKLSSKKETEKKRREERKSKYNKGIELIKAGKMIEGRKLLGESVDISHELAVNLMKECRKKNIDCIVAPYEADAQLAFLSINNIVKCVVTEDSDLLVYGCERVMFKMDTSGRGKLIEKSQLHLSLGMSAEEFSEEKFRYMCILSGCDYLPSLPSIGPANALKFVKMLNDKNIYEVLPKLPVYLNKLKITVSQEYIEKFKVAENTFKHQIIYDPLQRIEKPLTPVDDTNCIVGEKLPEDLAFQLAVGNIDPISMKVLDSYDPDTFGSGFTLIWKQDHLPKAVPRKIFNSNQDFDIKKRQRDNSEFSSVGSLTNHLKKQCLLQYIPKSKTSKGKNTLGKMSNSAFIFEPKVETNKSVDDSELLQSRYFFGKTKKQDSKENSTTDRRKDETSQDYLRRLYDEYFPDGEQQQSPCCDRSSDSCVACNKCSNCCRCTEPKFKNVEPQNFSKFVGELTRLKKIKNNKETNHSLLEELYKEEEEKTEELYNEEEEKIEDLYKEEEEKTEILNKSNGEPQETPNKLVLNLCHIFGENESVEELELLGKERNVEKENVKEERSRSPSPVFRINKESKVLNCSLNNVYDTAATTTSIYFSSKPFRRSSSMFTAKTPASSVRKLKSSKSVPAKVGRAVAKDCSAHRTLFQFGFKKECKEENNRKTIVEEVNV